MIAPFPFFIFHIPHGASAQSPGPLPRAKGPVFTGIFFLLLLFLPAAGSFAAPAPASPSPALQKLITEFDALSKDAVKGGRRDLWLELEQEFASLTAKSRGESAAKAAYYRACSRQELARRSFLPADYRNAASLLLATADKYGRSPVAPAALYRLAQIQLQSLDDPASAIRTLERLINRYPKAQNIKEANVLLAKAQADSGETEKAQTKKKPDEPSVTLKSIRWQGKGQRAVITLELDAATEYGVEFSPPNEAKKTPGRLHLDIDGAFPSPAVKPGLKPQHLVVSRIRASHSGNGMRITLDCDGLRCYAVTSPPKSPQTIQIEVSRQEDIAGGVMVADKPASRKRGKAEDTESLKPQDKVMEQLGLTVRTIMLDPGHGGKDPGAMAGGIEEAQFTLAMAKRVGALLQKEGFTVLYTRTSNKYITLQDRPDIANSKKADLFISIHINANQNSAVRGLETYYLDAAKTQDAALVAARENSVSVRNISDLQVILTDLMLSSKVKESRHLAQCIQAGILKRLRAASLACMDNGSRSAPFYVLVGARMPAILVEFGYITNNEDLASLRSEAFLNKQAEGIVQGVKQYKQELARIALQ